MKGQRQISTDEFKKLSDSEPDEEESSEDDSTSEFSSEDESQSEEESMSQNNDGEEDVEEEDSVVVAIRNARDKPSEKPKDIKTEDYFIDISFHPSNDLIAGASATGDVIVYKYSVESTELLETYELHTKPCRAVEYSQNGDLLFSAAADKSIMVTDSATGKLKQFYEEAHEDPLYTLSVINEHLIATGDDIGVVRMWDLREKKHIFSSKKIEDYVSKIITNEQGRYLVCTSGEGTVTSFDITAKCMYIQSELYEAELTCAGLIRKESKLVVGSSQGSLVFYNWGEFGLHTDEMPWAKKKSINCLLPVSENIVVTGWEDGQIMATYLFPHKQLGVVGCHDMSVEALDISHDGEFIASSSLDQKLRFWPISFFENPDLLTNDTNSEQYNLPSSNVVDRSNFFADLA